MITLDFETYYDREYSLSKVSTEAYIRDPRFQVIGVSVKQDDGDIEWISGTDSEIREGLSRFDFENQACVAHNAVFDMAILSWVYGIRPKFIVDTLSMARPVLGLSSSGCSLRALSKHFGIGEKGTEVYNTLGKRYDDFTPEELARFGEYCRQDVNLTYKLLPYLLKTTTKQELRVIDLTIRMFTEPKLVLNTELLNAHLSKVIKQKEDMLLQFEGVDRSEFMSNDKFAEMLRSLGVEPPTKVSPTTGKATYAFAKTDDGFKALLEHEDERVQALASARLGLKSTLEETRTKAFLDISKRGPLPILLNYYGASNTGRFCLTGDTVITVCRDGEVQDIVLSDLLNDDLVWDGDEFVPHGGLVCRGEREVIEYQGITGTPDHRVFVEENHGEEGPISLFEASLGGYTLETAKRPVPSREPADLTDSD